MDFADIGSDAAEKNTEDAIARTLYNARIELRTNKFPITGSCYNIRCGDDSPGRPFCSIKCRDEYDRMQKVR